MCELFALSARRQYSAPKSLPVFALQGRKNMDGWGIGYYRNCRAFVEKSASQVYIPGILHDSFQRLARVVRSNIIISHIRFRTSGPVDECHAHPFVMNFLGYDWIFAHNGKAPSIESYRTRNAVLEDLVSDSARAFEFLRDHILEYYEKSKNVPGLFDALEWSTSRMLEEYPGEYNYLLTNGRVLFAFTNHRQFMVLRGSKELEGALIITTVEKGLSKENWWRIAKATNTQGLLLAFSSTDLIFQRPIQIQDIATFRIK
ncbi:MAG TPA: hypothetical protein ENG51_03505 [Deltaproteobacteria bacterium]|nr:hypothetical protein [Deltaproteobacteria bacterium]